MLLLLHFQPPPPTGLKSADSGDSDDFINSVTRLSEDEALAQGYTLIKSADDLNNIRNNLSGKYILMNDIDLSSYDNWDPIGDTSNRFNGIFDGNGYVIKNLTINRPTEDNVGLFGYTVSANIQNVGLENVEVTGKEYVGGLF